MSVAETETKLSFAPPIIIQSTAFILHSNATIEINDIPIADPKAARNPNCFNNINVSSNTDVIRPLKIAKDIIAIVGQGIE